MEDNDDVMLQKLYWQNFIMWREEKFNCTCQWFPTLSGTDIMQDGKFIAYKTSIPERYYVLKEYITGTPWEKLVTTVTQ